MNKPIVIAISGASGCGKTSLIEHLAKRYNCPKVLFDDHVDANTYPSNMKEWLAQGANVNKIVTADFNKKIANVLTEFPEVKFVFIEEPFGRQRASVASLVDYVILLDLPLSLCLARIIQRNKLEKSSSHLANYLVRYHDFLHEVYLEAVAQVRANCDLIISEVLSVTELAQQIDNWFEVKSNQAIKLY